MASAAHIYIYKNLRPYFKFTLPTLDIQPMEKVRYQLYKGSRDEGSNIMNQKSVTDQVILQIGFKANSF